MTPNIHYLKMKDRKSFPYLIASALLCLAFLNSTAAQTRRTTNPPSKSVPKPPTAVAKEPVPTFDTLLAADSYKLYSEVRGLGQLIQSNGVNDLLEPVMKLTSPPKEFRTLVKWLNAHADAVMTSRMLCASLPSRPKLPQVICAIEFSSEQEARDFEPQLRGFLPKLLPAPSPTPSPSPPPAQAPAQQQIKEETANTPAAPPFFIKHTGTLVLVSDSAFAFKSLRPSGSKLLTETHNFRMVRDRFTSEPVFIYFDMAQEDRTRPKPVPTPEGAVIAEMVENEPPEEPPEVVPAEAVVVQAPDAGPSPVEQQIAVGTTSLQSSGNESAGVFVPGGQQEKPAPPPPANMALMGLSSLLFQGQPSWPDAVGAALVFESDTFIVRLLLVNGAETKGVIIPFIPQLLSGPALVPNASSILPADTDLFFTASLDYTQIYEGMLRTSQGQAEQSQQRSRSSVRFAQAESPFASYEKMLGINLKNDLIPLLGNEIALSMPLSTIVGTSPSAPAPSPSPSPETALSNEDAKPAPKTTSPVIAISIKDREGVRALIPKIIGSLGFKGAEMLAQTERREDTELVTYGGVLAYALLGDFLVFSPDSTAVRHVVDSYLKHETLGSDSHFRNSTRWQPRQVLGQLYISPALMDTSEAYASDVNAPIDEAVRNFIAGLGPQSEPVTYSLSNEGLGPLHELHVPRKLLMLMIAGLAGGSSQSSIAGNESIAQAGLRSIAAAQATFKAAKRDGQFGSLPELIEEGLVPPDTAERYGYRIELTVFGGGFEARAIPLEYGKTGRMSYFIDESSVLRGGDQGGGPATVANKPVQ